MSDGSPVLRFTPNEWRPFFEGTRHGVPGLLQTDDYAREVHKIGAHQPRAGPAIYEAKEASLLPLASTNGPASLLTASRVPPGPTRFVEPLANSAEKASNLSSPSRTVSTSAYREPKREPLMTKNNDPGPPAPG